MDIINKLKGLREIKPSNEFAAISKLIIFNGEENKISGVALVGKLAHLKRLTPTAHFSAISREIILSHVAHRPITLGMAVRKSFNYSLAMGVMVVFMALITSVSYLGFLSPIPTDIYGKNVTDSTNAIKEINIHLKEVEYFAATDSKVSLALREASITNPLDHASPMLIEHESQKANFKDPRNGNIDALLNQATL